MRRAINRWTAPAKLGQRTDEKEDADIAYEMIERMDLRSNA
jgi:hypothetical protein